MRKIEDGVYRLNHGAIGLMPCGPRSINLDVIPGMFVAKPPAWEKAAVHVVRFCKKHDAWCGVTRSRLLEEVRKHDLQVFSAINIAILSMVKNGMLIIPAQNEWLSFLPFFSMPVVCPTHLLIGQILAHQRAVGDKGPGYRGKFIGLS